MKEFKNFKKSKNNKILFILPLNKIEEVYLNECIYSLSEQEETVDLLLLNHGLNEGELDKVISILDNPKVERTRAKQGNPNEQETYESVGKNKLNYLIQDSTADTFAKVFNESLNYAHKNNYEWFTVFEHDDFFTKFWVKYFNIYASEKNEYDVLVPLTKQTGPMGFIGFMNEASWVDGFAEVAGIFDLNLLLRFNCISITGTAFKTASIVNYSEEKDGIYKPMKESMKINYSYEFLLRMIYNDLKFFTVPRLGYDCKVNRQVDKYDYFSPKLPLDLIQKDSKDGGITVEEYKFWTDLCKKEYFFDNDRNKKYEPA